MKGMHVVPESHNLFSKLFMLFRVVECSSLVEVTSVSQGRCQNHIINKTVNNVSHRSRLKAPHIDSFFICGHGHKCICNLHRLYEKDVTEIKISYKGNHFMSVELAVDGQAP